MLAHLEIDEDDVLAALEAMPQDCSAPSSPLIQKPSPQKELSVVEDRKCVARPVVTSDADRGFVSVDHALEDVGSVNMHIACGVMPHSQERRATNGNDVSNVASAGVASCGATDLTASECLVASLRERIDAGPMSEEARVAAKGGISIAKCELVASATTYTLASHASNSSTVAAGLDSKTEVGVASDEAERRRATRPCSTSDPVGGIAPVDIAFEDVDSVGMHVASGEMSIAQKRDATSCNDVNNVANVAVALCASVDSMASDCPVTSLRSHIDAGPMSEEARLTAHACIKITKCGVAALTTTYTLASHASNVSAVVANSDSESEAGVASDEVEECGRTSSPCRAPNAADHLHTSGTALAAGALELQTSANISHSIKPAAQEIDSANFGSAGDIVSMCAHECASETTVSTDTPLRIPSGANPMAEIGSTVSSSSTTVFAGGTSATIVTTSTHATHEVGQAIAGVANLGATKVHDSESIAPFGDAPPSVSRLTASPPRPMRDDSYVGLFLRSRPRSGKSLHHHEPPPTDALGETADHAWPSALRPSERHEAQHPRDAWGERLDDSMESSLELLDQQARVFPTVVGDSLRRSSSSVSARSPGPASPQSQERPPGRRPVPSRPHLHATATATGDRVRRHSAASRRQPSPSVDRALPAWASPHGQGRRTSGRNQAAPRGLGVRGFALRREAMDANEDAGLYAYLSSIMRAVEEAPAIHAAAAVEAVLHSLDTFDACGRLPDACAICLEDMGLGQRISRLPCRHCFHFTCIRSWLPASLTCPLCKRPAGL